MARWLILSICILSFAACTCRTKVQEIDPAAANIPLVEEGMELRDVNFAFDSAELTPSTREVLRHNAEWLKENPEASVVIEGHCDERGTREYNLALGQRRAQSVYDFMRSLGIQASRMDTVSYGEDQPLDPRSTEAAWEKNRRAHFRIN